MDKDNREKIRQQILEDLYNTRRVVSSLLEFAWELNNEGLSEIEFENLDVINNGRDLINELDTTISQLIKI